jgi:hypothetical protein
MLRDDASPTGSPVCFPAPVTSDRFIPSSMVVTYAPRVADSDEPAVNIIKIRGGGNQRTHCADIEPSANGRVGWVAKSEWPIL